MYLLQLYPTMCSSSSSSSSGSGSGSGSSSSSGSGSGSGSGSSKIIFLATTLFYSMFTHVTLLSILY